MRLDALEYELGHRLGALPTLEGRVEALEAAVKLLADGLNRTLAVLQQRLSTETEGGHGSESEAP